ncbi:hypothetical protein LAJ53_05935, partial [Streptococcus pneumoniae]|nr:hypothetical protein [Streptococcus pneumoniae]
QILKQITTCLIQYHIKKSPKSIDITAILFILPYISSAISKKSFKITSTPTLLSIKIKCKKRS